MLLANNIMPIYVSGNRLNLKVEFLKLMVLRLTNTVNMRNVKRMEGTINVVVYALILQVYKLEVSILWIHYSTKKRNIEEKNIFMVKSVLKI